jgi:hypothetical protein
MKKHLGLLFLFVIQNVCAMELDPLAMTLKYDGKCKLVAKYLYKYPQGEKDGEAGWIKLFLNDTKSKRAALSRSVNRYKNMLHNMDAEETLHNMYTANLPCDIKKNILAQVLWGYAAQYYAMYNTCKFVCMETGLIPSSCYAWPSQYYMPYFLEEILERDNRYVFLSTTKLDDNSEVSAYNNFRIRYSDFDHNNNSCKYNDSEIDMFCCMKSIHGDNKLCCMPFKSTIGTLKDLVLFLQTKALRVLALKQSFNKSVEKVARMKDKEGINAFIQLLTLYKALPKDIASVYTCEIPRSIPMMLQELSPLYEREINRKRIEKSAISGLQHLS